VRIGVVSDTHNNLKNVRRIVELFNAADVERVIHTGDISQAKTLDVLAGLSAPLPLELEGVHTDQQDLVLHGHTHRQRIERREYGNKTQLIFNPGECAGHMKGYNAIGIVDLETLEPEILNF